MKYIALLNLLAILWIPLTQCQEEEYLIKVFKEHKNKVKSVVFSKSGNYLASGCEGKMLIIRDLKNEDNNKVFSDNYFAIKDIEFFGDKQLFVTAGPDVKLVDTDNKQLALFKGSTTHIWSLDFAPERSMLVAGSYDKNINVWNVRLEKKAFELNGHEKNALAVSFSGDEKYLASGSRDETVKVWNAQNGDLLHSFERHSGNIYDVRFHPNARYLASASADKTIRLWDIEEQKVVKTYTGHDGSIVDVKFSPEGYFMYSAGVDGVVYIWEVSTGNKIYSYVEHIGSVNAIDISNDGFYAATSGDDGKVILWKSAMIIAMDVEFSDKILAEKNQNPVFDQRRKGENKTEYLLRLKEGEKVEQEIYLKYFNQYKQKRSSNVPTP